MNDAVMNQRTDRVLFVWLLFASLFGALIGVPWAMAASGDPATAWRLAGSSLLQLVPACAVGVWLGRKVGLGSGLMEAVRTGLMPGTSVGLAIGVVVFLGMSSISGDALIAGLDNPTIFEVFLRCLSAALTEEIAFRFGLMTFFVWVIRSVFQRPAIHATALWVGNLLAALLFTAAHFPGLTADAWSPAVLIPYGTFSTAIGLVLGWLFMRYGLVSAICAHFVADVVQGVIPRLVAVIT
jgi:membrane protease YdiL (CAAX protease family)